MKEKIEIAALDAPRSKKLEKVQSEVTIKYHPRGEVMDH
jgi:hypothetical protein